MSAINIIIIGRQGNIDQANAAIDNAYRSVFNFRLGGEFRMGNFAVRAGGGYFQVLTPVMNSTRMPVIRRSHPV